MLNVGQIERATQNRVVNLFGDTLKYRYLGNWEEREKKHIFIKKFFSTIQYVTAGNDAEGLRYGAIETPEKYYLTWKE